MSVTEAGCAAAFATDRPWRLNPQVALRDESFGALAYHYGNRRLTFLRDPQLVDVVRDLANHPSVDDALETVEPRRRAAFRRALAALSDSEVVRAR